MCVERGEVERGSPRALEAVLGGGEGREDRSGWEILK